VGVQKEWVGEGGGGWGWEGSVREGVVASRRRWPGMASEGEVAK